MRKCILSCWGGETAWWKQIQTETIIRLSKPPWVLTKASGVLKDGLWNSHYVLEFSLCGDSYVQIVMIGHCVHLSGDIMYHQRPRHCLNSITHTPRITCILNSILQKVENLLCLYNVMYLFVLGKTCATKKAFLVWVPNFRSGSSSGKECACQHFCWCLLHCILIDTNPEADNEIFIYKGWNVNCRGYGSIGSSWQRQVTVVGILI